MGLVASSRCEISKSKKKEHFSFPLDLSSSDSSLYSEKEEGETRLLSISEKSN